VRPHRAFRPFIKARNHSFDGRFRRNETFERRIKLFDRLSKYALRS